MPITDLAEAKDLDAAIQALLDAPPAAREQRLRAIFVEKLDFVPATGTVPLPGAKVRIVGEEQPAPRPVRIAQAGGVHVLWARLDDAKITSVNARAIVKAVGGQLDGDQLLVLSSADDSRWHIIWPSDSGGRTVLRRMVIERGLPRRTAVTQLAKIYQPKATADSLPARIDAAFDVAPVTKEFFKTYAAVFHRVSDMIGGIDDSERRRLFCQTLFNRLMFVYFLQRKGWLSLNGDRNYLRALRNDSKRTKDGSFYRDRLLILFFSALNNPDSRNLSRGVRAAVGDVPFLNGGLFEKGHIDEECAGATVPDEAFDLIFDELFARFNFTVSENTPYDVEVAVDPEMLGKVFEELVTGRHETGSYYTPRQVVAFMCREALKGYLETRVEELGADAARRFIDEHDASALNLTQARKVSDALDDVTVVDPACGSGAYLVGMLHELIELQKRLYSEKLQRDADRLYEMKLHIIERNLYGADIDEFATNIAMLRLWLTLAIEFDGDDPPPLPNLDFKIANGDSLTAPNPSTAGDLFRHAMHEASVALSKLKGDYLKTSGAKKARLRREIEAAERKLERATADAPSPPGSVDWRVAFAEVFDRGGFDVVLANPPYVTWTLTAQQRNILKALYSGTVSGKLNTYRLFYHRAIDLSRPDGMIVFITPTTWLAAPQSTALRKYLTVHCTLAYLGVCPESARVFEKVTQEVVIAVLHHRRPSGNQTVRVVDPVRSIDDIGSAERILSWRKISSFAQGVVVTSLTDDGMELLYRLEAMPLLAEAADFFQGEVNLTNYSKFIRTSAGVPSVRPMARGDDLEPFFVRVDGANHKGGWVDSTIIPRTHWISDRVVIQQVTNMAQRPRLFAAHLSGGVLCGNSLNYAVAKPSMSQELLLAVLNSWVADFAFRARSRTNHITVEELKALPWIGHAAMNDRALIREVTQLVHRIASQQAVRRDDVWRGEDFARLQELVFDLFRLTSADRGVIRHQYARGSPA